MLVYLIVYFFSFWTTVCKTVRRMLSDRCLSCPAVLSVLSVCLWRWCIVAPNGWMDQVATWHGGRPRPRPRCVRWGPTERGTLAPYFSTHVYCD